MLSTETKKALGPLFTIANKIRLQLLKIKYSGKGVYCPCCGSEYREFAVFGNERRKNAWCPNCESLERHRLLWMFFEKKTSLYSGNCRLLHIAPETIFYKLFEKKSGIDYYPADKFNTLYPEKTKYMDILEIDQPDESFDAVICNHVFQYIEEDAKAMSELFRVLKKGGWAVMQVPINKKLDKTHEDPTITDPLERERVFGLKEHVRFYAPDYADRLRKAGFTVQAIDYTSEFSDADIFKYGFWKGDDIYYCTK